MGDCNIQDCECMVCLEVKPLLRTDCHTFPIPTGPVNTQSDTHHYLCQECLSLIRQYNQEPDRYDHERQIKWKRCPICRGSIKRASSYAPNKRPTLMRGNVVPNPDYVNRQFLAITELQDTEFERQQDRENDDARMRRSIEIGRLAQLILDANNDVRRIEWERDEIIAQREAELLNIQNNVNEEGAVRESSMREHSFAALIIACGMAVYYIISTLTVIPMRGGGTNQDLNGFGIIYIGKLKTDDKFGLWLSLYINDNFITIQISSVEHYNKLVKKYVFTPKTEIDITNELNFVNKKNNTKKGGSTRKKSRRKKTRRKKTRRKKN